MTASFYLRQQWRDPRLASSTSNQTVLLNHRRVDSIWLPDMYFSQSKNEYSHIVTVPNLLIRVRPDGTILFSQRSEPTDSLVLLLSWCFTATETVWFIKDGESVEQEMWAEDQLLVHTAPELCEQPCVTRGLSAGRRFVRHSLNTRERERERERDSYCGLKEYWWWWL